MNKPKIFYGQKWVNDNSVVLAGSKSKHEDKNLPMYEYIEYTQEVEQALNNQRHESEWVIAQYSLKERIAELEEQLLRSKANYFDLNSEFQQCLDCCKRVGELEAEDEWKQKQIVSQRKRIAELEEERDAAFNKGMERAAEILNSSSHREEAEYRIRKEIEK